MRHKNTETMKKIVKFANEYHRLYGRSPSTTEIAEEVGLARGTAYTYLVAMKERGMIGYDGKNIVTNLSSLVNILSYINPYNIVRAYSDVDKNGGVKKSLKLVLDCYNENSGELPLPVKF